MFRTSEHLQQFLDEHEQLRIEWRTFVAYVSTRGLPDKTLTPFFVVVDAIAEGR
jgi:hypothetical protein